MGYCWQQQPVNCFSCLGKSRPCPALGQIGKHWAGTEEISMLPCRQQLGCRNREDALQVCNQRAWCMSAMQYRCTQVRGTTWSLCTVTLQKQRWFWAAKTRQAPEAGSMLENVQKHHRTRVTWKLIKFDLHPEEKRWWREKGNNWTRASKSHQDAREILMWGSRSQHH